MNAPTPSPYSDETFYLLVVMLLLGVFMLFKVGSWYRQWKSPTARVMSLDEAREEFGNLMSERLGVAMRAAELDKIIIDKWDEWPLEYRPPLYQVIRHTQLLEETMLEEAMEKGVYPRRIVTQGPAIPPPPPKSRLPELVEVTESTPPPDPVSSEEPESKVVALPSARTLPSARWINGQIVKTG